MGAFPAVSRRRAFSRPLRLTAILNGRRELLPPGTFPTLWTNIEEMVEAGEIQCIDLVLRNWRSAKATRFTEGPRPKPGCSFR